MNEEEVRVVDAMWKFGGSFVKCLAEAMRHADPVNLGKLKSAFPEYWKQYDDMSRVPKDEPKEVSGVFRGPEQE